MMDIQLFDRYGEGGEEIRRVLGLVADRVDFETWRPLLPLGVRDVMAVVGPDAVKALAAEYMSELPKPEMQQALFHLRQAVAMFTWIKIIPTLDAHHDTDGRRRKLGENEKGMTALEQYKDEANVQRLAYEALEALVADLDEGSFGFWVNSPDFNRRRGLLIRSKEEFDRYYHIGSHRLFLTLTPMIGEVQQSAVAPVVGRRYMDDLMAGKDEVWDALGDTAMRVIALLTMKKAVERLPVEVLPEGVVQVNQSAPVNQRLKAEKSARESVALSLAADADRYLRQLEDAVAELRSENAPPDLYMPRPITHSKGFSF